MGKILPPGKKNGVEGSIELCQFVNLKKESIVPILKIEALFTLVSYISTFTFWAFGCLHQKSEIQSNYYLQVPHLTEIRFRH